MIESDVSAVVYSGNGSTSTGYPVAFPFFDAAHIYVSVQPQGGSVALLSSGQFTVHESGAGAPYVTTAEAYPSTTQVTVFRSLPFTQPATFANPGPFDAPGMERALDRLLMQVLQLYRAVTGGAGGSVIIPLGGVSAQDVAAWADDAARATIIPKRVGQLGVQIDTRTIWISTATNAGQWQQVTASPLETKSLRLGFLADAGDPTNGNAALANSLFTAQGADYVIAAGDNNYNGNAAFDSDFAPLLSWITAGKLFPALGNHCIDSAGWAARMATKFPYLGTWSKNYYDRVLGGGLVHLIVLHSGRKSDWTLAEPDGNDIASAQHAWLLSRLAAVKARWRVVVFHHPEFTPTTDTHDSEPSMAWDWASLGVHAVLNGHNHASWCGWKDGVLHLNASAVARLDGEMGRSLAGAVGSAWLEWIEPERAAVAFLNASAESLSFEFRDCAEGRMLHCGAVGSPTPQKFEFSEDAWGPSEPLDDGTRWLGSLPRACEIEEIHFAQAEAGPCTVQLYVGIGRQAFPVPVAVNGFTRVTRASFSNHGKEWAWEGAALSVQVFGTYGSSGNGLRVTILGRALT